MTDYSELHKLLLEERTRLQSELDNLDRETHDADEEREGSPFGKREEEATEVYEFEKRMALKNELEETLVKVERALDKYEAGKYGICDVCEQPIAVERLEALPHASLCINCKALQTKNAKN
jgi:RNA polymerase-binding protein DksA